MTGLLILLAAIFTGCSCYYLSCAFADIPTVRTSKAMMTTRKQTGSGSEKLFDVYLTRIARLLAPVIRLDPVKRGKLQTTLEIAELSLTPEAYTAKAFLSALAVAFLSLPLFLIMPLLGFLVLGLSILMWFSTYYGAFDYVKKRKVLIEQELPRLAVSIQQSLANDRDVLKLLVSYRRIAGPELGKELDTTIADMKTGNYENALLRFQNRIGSTMLSDIVRGLIGTLRGDDQQMYFRMLAFDMRQMEQSNLKKEAAKRPNRCRSIL